MSVETYNIEERIRPDGNCLFRSFSYFLYNDQEKHRQVRLRVVANVIEKWSLYEPFIIGDESYSATITDIKSYKKHMSNDCVYGGEVEIQSFVQIYNARVLVCRDDGSVPNEYGPCSNNGTLTVLLSGTIDAGHYDVINSSNFNFWANYRKHYNHVYHEKHKDSINEKKRVKNLTESSLSAKRETDKVENMSEERLRKKREKDVVKNLNEERLRKKREKDVVKNLNEERLRKKREKDVVENLNEERLKRKRKKDVAENLNEERLKRKRKKDVVENMKAERLTKKREKAVAQNLNEERLKKKRENDLTVNLNDDRLKKKRKNDLAENLNEDRLQKKKDNNLTQNLNENRLKIKRENDTVENMTNDRVIKRRNVQQAIKLWPHKTTYFDFGDMDYICPYCSAVFWDVEFSKKSCCHYGKVKLPPLSDYDENLKNLLLQDRKYRQLIRYYNSRFSFASFNANVVNDFKQGVYNLKIQGQVCHITPNTIYSEKGETPHGGQIYIYDDYEATKQRLKESKNLSEKHIQIISQVLNNLNPYAKKYKCLYELSKNEEMPEYNLYFVRNINLDKHRYNSPSTAECAALIVSKDGDVPTRFDLCVYPKSLPEGVSSETYLNKLSFHVDPMTFPIMFPCGDLGWSPLFTHYTNNAKRLTALQFYSYRLAYRPNHKFNPVLFCGRLTQQYVIEAYIIIESNRLNFFRYNQKKLRIECYQGIVDHVARSVLNDSNNFKSERLGNIFVLPSTYLGSPRNMHQNYQDAMAIVRTIGRPDLFITMTCNPNWPELQRVLNQFPAGTTCNDIPNITVRLFYSKLRALLADVISGKLFGNILAWVYTIEFQKRGLPHAHMLFVLDYKNKLTTPESIDKYISAEIPTYDLQLQELVMRHMLHGPHTDYSPCYDKEKDLCSKKFPKQFREFTEFEKNGFPKYRRRDNHDAGHVYNKKINGDFVSVDNSMVVPYNPEILKRYTCHVNVEYCASVMSIKYIYKYLHKGHDRAFVKVKKNNQNVGTETYDEISDYIDSRYVSPMEAAWRIEELPLSDRSHPIVRLAVHLENQQHVVFEENKEKNALVKYETTLTAWFKLNLTNERAKELLYINIPNYYLFDLKKKMWVRRRLYSKAIGRVVSVSPKDVERFHLKLILHRVKGATCFNDLRTYEGVNYNTFKEAAIAMGLVESDVEIFKIFEEACAIMMPTELRKFFAWFVISDNFVFSREVWDKFKQYFCEGFRDYNECRALQEINEIFKLENRKCSDFNLPEPDENLQDKINFEREKEIMIYHENTAMKIIAQLNADQRLIFDYVTKKDNNKMIYIDGPGGTGKTFLYEALIHYFLGIGNKVLSMAWTGIASILLPGGMTSHRTFRLPLDLSGIETTFLKLDSDKKRLRESDVIIWDEASMIPKKALEIVDKTLRDCCNIDHLPFAGKLIILGGDFRQILPVVKYGTKHSIINETIKFSSLWPQFETMKLTKNMRTCDRHFSAFLLKIGRGIIKSLQIPDNWRSDDICTTIYGTTIDENTDLSNRAILACHNEDVYKLNDIILEKIDNKEKVYYSIDCAKHKGVDQADFDVDLNYPIEYLNSLKFPGLPIHKLRLKIGAIVMLIRNLSISDGLCNGTRMKIIGLFKFNIKVEIITGTKAGNCVFIPRIILDTGELSALPFILYRRQFPIVLAFAITINKSQGQSLERVGIYFRRSLFSHGQLYVALSRCKNPDQLFIENDSEDFEEINNVVWREVFD